MVYIISFYFLKLPLKNLSVPFTHREFTCFNLLRSIDIKSILKKHISILVFIAIYFMAALHSIAQSDTIKNKDEIIINGKHYKAVDDSNKSQNKKRKIPTDSMFVTDNKKFKYYNNWLTAGAGVQENLTRKSNVGFAAGLNFNFHIRQHYFQTGTEITGERFGNYNNAQFHLGYGKRFEDKNVNFAAFLGFSYSSGFQITQIDSLTYNKRHYNQPGLYFQAEVIKKITYDVGLGANLFADWNQEQTLIGIRFILYFSGAYKGKNNEYLRN